ncbi:MAG: hypothetical protein FGF53_06890 [Candidatus Brockarchaeota archaeon]|nr:hypothetical protein [Candidatus Brockarchaeota archaeon]
MCEMENYGLLGFNPVKLTILADNEAYLEGLSSTWGLSICIEAKREGVERKVLMDTGGSYDAFTYNSLKLRKNLSIIKAVFSSHWHRDHCGCLKEALELLEPGTLVYVSSLNRSGLKSHRRRWSQVRALILSKLKFRNKEGL